LELDFHAWAQDRGTRSKEEPVMNDLDIFDMFIARTGNLYTRKGLCPPFRLREYAIRWRDSGTDLEFCLEQIRVHLEKHFGWYRCGAGDWGMEWLDMIIRGERFERNRAPGFAVFEHYGKWIAE
jgi:hypothetical protein